VLKSAVLTDELGRHPKPITATARVLKGCGFAEPRSNGMACGPRPPESAATRLGNPRTVRPERDLQPRQHQLLVEVAGRPRRTTSTICRDGLPTLVRLIANMPNPTARVQLRQLLERCFRHERIQMMRPVHHATTTGKISDDGFMAPANSLCNLSAGTALKPRLDCQTPYVVAWTISFHSALTKCDIPLEQHCGVAIGSRSTPRRL